MAKGKRRRTDLLRWGPGTKRPRPQGGPQERGSPESAAAAIPPELQAAVEEAVAEAMQERGDPVTRALLDVRRDMTPYERRKRQYDRERTRGSYDLPRDVIEAIRLLSERWECSRSDVVAWLLARAILAGLSDECPPRERSREANLRYPCQLQTPSLEAWLREAETAAGQRHPAESRPAWPDPGNVRRYLRRPVE